MEHEPALFLRLEADIYNNGRYTAEGKTTWHIVKENSFLKKNIISDGKLCML